MSGSCILCRISLSEKIDAIYASMHFERVFLPDEYEGTPLEAEHVLADRIQALEAQEREAQETVKTILEEKKRSLQGLDPSGAFRSQF